MSKNYPPGVTGTEPEIIGGPEYDIIQVWRVAGKKFTWLMATCFDHEVAKMVCMALNSTYADNVRSFEIQERE